MQFISKNLQFSFFFSNFAPLKQKFLILLFAAICFVTACAPPSTPRPYGYFRITIPPYSYRSVGLESVPYTFEISSLAYPDTITPHSGIEGLDIVYPSLNARIHCTYKPIDRNLRQLSDEAQRMVFDHAIIADAIPERGYTNAEARVYGVYYELEGNTASPVQFYVTDSTTHFFRAALYYMAIPNADSLSPVNALMQRDIRHLIETFRWQSD